MIDTATRLHNRPEGNGLTALALAAGLDPEAGATWLTGFLADFGLPLVDHHRLVSYLELQATPTVELEREGQPPPVGPLPRWVRVLFWAILATTMIVVVRIVKQ